MSERVNGVGEGLCEGHFGIYLQNGKIKRQYKYIVCLYVCFVLLFRDCHNSAVSWE